MNFPGIPTIISFMVLLSQIFIIAILILLAAKFMLRKNKGFFARMLEKKFAFISRYGLLSAFIVALVATSGSLYFSEIAGLTPCKLCWFQRILAYPLVIILGVALIRRDRKVWTYVIPMNILNMLIAAYHYYIQVLGVQDSFCSANAAESCVVRPILHFGYISIPLMSFTAAALILIFMLLIRKDAKKAD
jgi:hypothetical protein